VNRSMAKVGESGWVHTARSSRVGTGSGVRSPEGLDGRGESRVATMVYKLRAKI
jgi:hypothetical protein